MSVAGGELATLVIEALRGDAALAADLAAVLRPHLQPQEQPVAVGWMDSRKAAAYLGLTLPALHRLTAARSIPFEQDKPGGKCWFSPAALDDWRRRGGTGSVRRGAT